MVTAEVNVQRTDASGFSLPDPIGYVPGGSSGGNADSADSGPAVEPSAMVEAEINVADEPMSESSSGARSLSTFGGGLSLPDSIDLPVLDPDDDPPDR
jgi:hypothetical protein